MHKATGKLSAACLKARVPWARSVPPVFSLLHAQGSAAQVKQVPGALLPNQALQLINQGLLYMASRSCSCSISSMQCAMSSGYRPCSHKRGSCSSWLAECCCATCSAAAQYHEFTKVEAPHQKLSCCKRKHHVPSAHCKPPHNDACKHNV